MKTLIVAIVFIFLLIILPTTFCVAVHVMYRISDKIMRRNILGDTVADIKGISDKIRYESVTRLPDSECGEMFIREYGGDIYGDVDIRAKDILTKDTEDIPDDIPGVDIPLFKPF